MLSPVIAGVDGSAEGLAAAEWAAREAVRRNRPLHLLHVWDRYPHGHHSTPASTAHRYPARRALREAEDRVRRACPGVRLGAAEQVEGPATAALADSRQCSG